MGGDDDSRRHLLLDAGAELRGDDLTSELAASLEAALEPLAEGVGEVRIHHEVRLTRTRVRRAAHRRVLALRDLVGSVEAVPVLLREGHDLRGETVLVDVADGDAVEMSGVHACIVAGSRRKSSPLNDIPPRIFLANPSILALDNPPITWYNTNRLAAGAVARPIINS